MINISNYIQKINNNNKKALSIFLTAGFPTKKDFVDIAKNVLNSGADMLEIGIPFSDPLADGPVIQYSSQVALENKINLDDVFEICSEISNYTDKPLILMGYANPIIKYGTKKFCKNSVDTGVSGLIVPDVPLEEFDSFYNQDFSQLQKILLTTPTSSNERIKMIDEKSEGFVYCVSVTGTTGVRNTFDETTFKNLKRTYTTLERNKMMIGFGISNSENVKSFIPYCDGVIVGSAVIKMILEKKEMNEINSFISNLSKACKL
ncbi:tryptophan synthase subunit alpha [Stygiobacter electus]|uniref:Tryptophan synthase alpha chain n=1 Tax=Stygiobacter electus TaxID=3032292 RepID=A0AAE3NYA1_9BACT|nr:tryptophan synthase subunit alpha [Stygiobacter electus]MDF1613166.1 tryptophan synthase subunit alpha [Stygiobacter electus]